MDMKIIATVRTRNEAQNIGRFCRAYNDWVDEILVADGGSEDETRSIASQFSKVSVLDFPYKQPLQNDEWINPQGPHVNFVVDNAIARGADWVIFDDCDCVPNFMMRETGRRLFQYAENGDRSAIYSRRIYLWGEDEHFPRLHEPNTSIWAWKVKGDGKVLVRADETDLIHLRMRLDEIGLRKMAYHLKFPLCLLHFSWPTPEAAEKKVNWYRKSGVQPTAAHPLEFGGPLEPIDWFMKEER